MDTACVFDRTRRHLRHDCARLLAAGRLVAPLLLAQCRMATAAPGSELALVGGLAAAAAASSVPVRMAPLADIAALGFAGLDGDVDSAWLRKRGDEVPLMACAEVMELCLEVRERSLLALRRLRARLAELADNQAIGVASSASASLPSFVHDASTLIEAAIAASATIVNARPDCTPWVVREPLLMLLHGWGMIHQGFLQILWWGFQYNILGNIADHPQTPAEADIAYIASLLEQTDVLLETDVLSANRDFHEYLATSVDPVVASHGISADQIVAKDAATDRRLRPAAAAGCGTDGHELLRRDTFDRWHTDYGLLGQLLREILAGLPPPALEPGTAPVVSLADVCGGGGHHAAFLAKTGLVAATAYGSSPSAPKLTFGRVQHLDMDWLAEAPAGMEAPPPLADWVLCLEAGARAPPGRESVLLRNLAISARVGLVVTWDAPAGCGGAPLPQHPPEAWPELVDAGLRLDVRGTGRLRARAELEEVCRGVLLFRRGHASGGDGRLGGVDNEMRRKAVVGDLGATVLPPQAVLDGARQTLQRVLAGMRPPALVD